MNNPPILIPELSVLNLKNSLDFYIKLAGFKIAYDRPEGNFAMLERNGAYLMVEELNNTNRFWFVGPMEKPFGRGINLQIEVEDIQLLYQNFRNAKYPLFLDIEEKWYRIHEKSLGQRQFLAQDPDGYLLRFYEIIGFKML